MAQQAWFHASFWYQLRFFRPHKINNKWFFIKRDICLPYHLRPVIEERTTLLKHDPPVATSWFSYIISSHMFHRYASSMVDHWVDRITKRGNCIDDYIGVTRRRIRYAVFAKNKDPYVYMLMGARNSRMRHWRTYGWQVPESQGPGEGLGMVPHHQDYFGKINRMMDDDWCDTSMDIGPISMIPMITHKKFFNELPRTAPFFYGMTYTKEQMYNHIAWGIDPGNEKYDSVMNPNDPEKKKKIDESEEMKDYYFSQFSVINKPGYMRKWPYPDDNVYRPTYNRGYNRRYWMPNP